MSSEIDLKILRNEIRLKRYTYFDWKKYFLKTFVFLLILNIVMLATIPQNLSRSEFLIQLAISLWVIILVCAIFTPMIGFWYREQRRKVSMTIQNLKDRKLLSRESD